MIQMEYNKFIQSAFEKIKTARQAALDRPINMFAAKLNDNHQNVYIQLLAQKNNKYIKIEHWSFITMRDLQESQYGESYDSELDSVQVQNKSFSGILEEILIQFVPRIPQKVIEPQQLILKLITDKRQLQPFIEQSNYVIDVSEYEGADFSTKVSLKLLHHQNSPSSEDLQGISQQQQFQVLIDPQFESERLKNNKTQKQEEINGIKQLQSPLKPHPDQKIIQKMSEKSKQTDKQIKKSQYYESSIIKTSTKQIYLPQQKQKSQKEILINEMKTLLFKLNLESPTVKELLDEL